MLHYLYKYYVLNTQFFIALGMYVTKVLVNGNIITLNIKYFKT